ncbi:MAG TPA: hypothetical protein VG123_18070 [Streptosporangiaceae bacterium]|nr:hypothetical protein [Streptosporangiaceae bacterium]
MPGGRGGVPDRAVVAGDPTNRAPAGERQVVVARGRDYPDVAPLTGICHGAPGRTRRVTAEVTASPDPPGHSR